MEHNQDATGVKQSVNGSLPSFEGVTVYEENRTVVLDSMSVRQKAALTVVSYSYSDTQGTKVPEDKIIGGIHLVSADSKRSLKNRVESYKQNRIIEPIVSSDLEGCIGPAGSFRNFTPFANISDSEEALKTGRIHGRFLSDIGADINFAPVADLDDNIWGCRSFSGSYREVADKTCSYIEGLQANNVIATTKHFPGSTLTGRDPHEETKTVSVSRRDLFPFRRAMDCGTKALMPSHQVSNGAFSTDGEPADAFSGTRREIRGRYGFDGLIVSDAISMDGLRNHYDGRRQRYIDLFRNNDLILNLVGGMNDTVDMIELTAGAVEDGDLDERFVTNSARRSLNARGWSVVTDSRVYGPWDGKPTNW